MGFKPVAADWVGPNSEGVGDSSTNKVQGRNSYADPNAHCNPFTHR